MINLTNSRLTSKFRTGFDNLSVPVAAITLIQKNAYNERLAVLYFYGLNGDNTSKVIRTWFYQSVNDLEKEVTSILKKYPNLIVQ